MNGWINSWSKYGLLCRLILIRMIPLSNNYWGDDIPTTPIQIVNEMKFDYEYKEEDINLHYNFKSDSIERN